MQSRRDILPFRDSDEKQIEEERRLMYVGITRAERSLQISYCNRRKRGKDRIACVDFTACAAFRASV